jgi:hypothetical protein
VKEKLKRQVKKIKETGADVIFSGGFFSRRRRIERKHNVCDALRQIQRSRNVSALFIENRLPILSVVVRREAWIAAVAASRLMKARSFITAARIMICGCVWRKAARSLRDAGKLVRYRVHGNAMSSKKIELLEATLVLCEDTVTMKASMKAR